MASRKDIEAGRATVTLFANTSPLMKGLRSVQGTMNSWGKSIMSVGAGVFGLGASITGGLAAAVGVFASMGGELADMSAKTGVAASSLAELKFAAEQSGTGLEAVEKALVTMSKKGLDPRQFDAYAAEIAALPAGVEQIQRAMEVWGKSGAELIPMLGELQALRQEARDLGLVPTDEAVKDAALIGDLWDKIGSVAMATVFEIGAALAQVLIPILEATVRIGASVNRWVRENGQLVRTVAAIGAGLLAAGAVIASIGMGFVAVGAVIGGIMTTLSAVGSILAFIVTPVGLIVAGVVAIGAAILVGVGYWLLFTKQGQATFAALKAAIAPVITAIQGISDALMAGDIGLAAEIAGESMKLAFFTAIDAIVKQIMFIPRGILNAMKSIAEFDPTGILSEQVAKAQLILRGVEIGATAGADPTRFNELTAKAKAAREAAALDMGNEGQYTSSQNGEAMGKLKSLGSFNATALTQQNYGRKQDPADKALPFLAFLKTLPAIHMAIKENQLAYGP